MKKTKEKAKKKTKGKKKISPRKKASSIKTKNTGGVSLEAFDLVAKNLGNLAGKKGFQVYQCYRNFFVDTFSDPSKEKTFSSAHSGYKDIITDFQLLDQAYLDNFMLCLQIRIKSPEIYGDTVKIIDKYVRPDKRNEGLNFLYQECSGFLVLLLKHYEGISTRQALYAAAKFTKFSESTTEKAYRRIIKKLHKNLGSDLPSSMILVLLYWTLYQKNIDPNKLLPIKKSARSTAKSKETISAYWHFTERVIRHHHKKISDFSTENQCDIIQIGAKEFGINLPLEENEIKKPNSFTVFFILAVSVFIELMPELFTKFDDIEKIMKTPK